MMIRLRFQRSGKYAPFIHPMNPAPRTAILVPGFRGSRTMRVFEEGWSQRAARFQPESVAGRVGELQRLAEAGVSLAHSVIVLTYEDEPGLNTADREFFWRAFGVPVYEQYLDSKNRLLAMECDAHSGLHVFRGCEHLQLERETCACGDRSPRVPRRARIEELVDLLA
jgi:hypothetical protein